MLFLYFSVCYGDIIFFKLTLKSHEWKMFIKANTLWTQSQIKLHKTNTIWNLNVTIWYEDNSQCTSIHATSAWVTSEQHCLLPSSVITEGQTTSTSIMHTFTVDQLPYRTHSLHLKVEHLILPECVTFSDMLVSILQRDIFLAVKSIFWYKMDGLKCTDKNYLM
jgi:hypothetical protein